MDYRPTIAITMGEPAGIGPEVIVKALADPVLRQRAKYVIYGMNELLAYAADLAEFDVFWWRDPYQGQGRLRAYPHDVVVVDYDNYNFLGTDVRGPSRSGGEASMRFCLDAIDAAMRGLVDGVVTAPIAKESWKLAGYGFPGHTELFASRTQAKQSIPGGQARPMIKAMGGEKIGFGLAQALITNELTCRTCKSVQHLPAGWQDRLRDTDWSCSACGRVILAWR